MIYLSELRVTITYLTHSHTDGNPLMKNRLVTEILKYEKKLVGLQKGFLNSLPKN